MKNVKKYPKKQLEKYSAIFMQLSLVLVLFIVYQLIEHETLQKKTVLGSFDDIETMVYEFDEPEKVFKKEKIKKKNVKLKKPIIDLNVVEKVKNDEVIPEQIIDLPVVDDDKLEEDLNALVDEDDDIEDKVPFLLIEDAPIYKGCEGLSKIENKKCFVKSIKKFVRKRFNIDLAQGLGLNPGKYRMFAQFVIDKKGNIDEVLIKAPHHRLKKEVNSIINRLPKFTPGMQRKVPVSVKFTLPVVFNVE